MQIEAIVCPEAIEDKLWSKHHVTCREARQVFLDQPRIRFAEKGHTPGEDVYVAFGQTLGRQVLVGLVHLQTSVQDRRDYQCPRHDRQGAQSLWTQVD